MYSNSVVNLINEIYFKVKPAMAVFWVVSHYNGPQDAERDLLQAAVLCTENFRITGIRTQS